MTTSRSDLYIGSISNEDDYYFYIFDFKPSKGEVIQRHIKVMKSNDFYTFHDEVWINENYSVSVTKAEVYSR